METPAIPPPKDSREQEVLDKLVLIRDRILLLKQDRTNYIRTQDVMALYDETVEQVRHLNESRKGRSYEENRGKIPLRALLGKSTRPLTGPQLIGCSRAASSFFRSSS